MLLADRRYDADWIRALARHPGAWTNIPPKEIGQRRYASVRIFTGSQLGRTVFDKIKHCRRVATRYDTFAANYLALV
jgi:transposase